MKKIILTVVMLMAVTGLAVADDWADYVTESTLEWYYNLPEINPAEEVEKMMSDEDKETSAEMKKATKKSFILWNKIMDMMIEQDFSKE